MPTRFCVNGRVFFQALQPRNPGRSGLIRILIRFAVVSLILPQSMALSQPPPAAQAREVIDSYQGVAVSDPYRWMESKSSEVDSWAKSQSDYTEQTLKRLPGYEPLLNRMLTLVHDYSFESRLTVTETQIFYVKVSGGANHGILCAQPRTGGPERTLVNPSEFDKKGAHASLANYWPSNDGRHLVFGIDTGGAENTTLYFLDVQSGREVEKPIEANRFAQPAWLPDNHSFVYTRVTDQSSGSVNFGSPTSRAAVYRHVFGGGRSQEKALFGDGIDTLSHIQATLAFTLIGQKYVFAEDYRGDPVAAYYIAPLSALNGKATPWRRIAQPKDGITSFDFHEETIYALIPTADHGMNLISTPLEHPDYTNADRLMADSLDLQISNFVAAEDALYVRCSAKGFSRFFRIAYQKDSHPEPIELPFSGFAGDPQLLSGGGIYFQLTGWTHPTEHLQYNPAKRSLSRTILPTPYPVDLVGFESEEVEVPSVGGALVPLTIIHRRGLRLDGSYPATLFGYGSYGNSLDPSFGDLLPWNPVSLAWIERNGIYAYAHVRGGGERGEDWHQAAVRTNKVIAVRDFIACAEYLISKGYTRAEHLTMQGGSAGGVLIGGALTQRPDLFRAAASFVGIHDLLRLELTPVGTGQISEFGTVKNKEEFKAMYALSPYHQVKAGVKYPAVFFYTGANDARVPQWEVTKMVARLQASSSSGRPIMFYEDYDSGHGAGLGIDQYTQITAMAYTFLLWQTGDPEFQMR